MLLMLMRFNSVHFHIDTACLCVNVYDALVVEFVREKL